MAADDAQSARVGHVVMVVPCQEKAAHPTPLSRPVVAPRGKRSGEMAVDRLTGAFRHVIDKMNRQPACPFSLLLRRHHARPAMAIRWQELGKRNVSPRKVPLNRDTIMRVGNCAQFGDETREAVEAVMHGSGSTFQELADEGFADLLKTRKRPVEAEGSLRRCPKAAPAPRRRVGAFRRRQGTVRNLDPLALATKMANSIDQSKFSRSWCSLPGATRCEIEFAAPTPIKGYGRRLPEAISQKIPRATMNVPNENASPQAALLYVRRASFRSGASSRSRKIRSASYL